MLSVSLDYLFFNAPLVFSNVFNIYFILCSFLVDGQYVFILMYNLVEYRKSWNFNNTNCIPFQCPFFVKFVLLNL
jgi:hypothetical protein